jgi:hypothetical protein
VYIAKNIKSLTILKILFDMAMEEEQHKWLNNKICKICEHIINIKILQL